MGQERDKGAKALPATSRCASFLLLSSVFLSLVGIPSARPEAQPLQDASDPAVAFVQQLEPFKPEGRVSGTIRLWGHGSHKRNFMGNLILRWSSEFRRWHPEVKFENRMYGTASAAGALYTEAGDIALLGEEISPAARAAFRRAKGYQPTEVLVATGSLDINYFDYAHMIFVHEDNPIAGLSLRELDGIFGAEHRRGGDNIRRWDQLGIDEGWSGHEIQIYAWQVDVDFALFFRERVLEDSHRWNPILREYRHLRYDDGSQYDHGQRILDALAEDPYGIAISNIRYARPGVKALPLAWRHGEPHVMPSKATLIDQTYPLVRLIPMIIDREPGQPLDPHLREFLRYLLSREGQSALLHETGYLPLSRAVIADQLERLE